MPYPKKISDPSHRVTLSIPKSIITEIDILKQRALYKIPNNFLSAWVSTLLKENMHRVDGVLNRQNDEVQEEL